MLQKARGALVGESAEKRELKGDVCILLTNDRKMRN